MSWRAVLTAMLALLVATSLAGCPENAPATGIHGQTKLTPPHTSDIHSRLFPYALQITQVDGSLGLGSVDSIATVGGVARVASVIGRERARSGRRRHLCRGG